MPLPQFEEHLERLSAHADRTLFLAWPRRDEFEAECWALPDGEVPDVVPDRPEILEMTGTVSRPGGSLTG